MSREQRAENVGKEVAYTGPVRTSPYCGVLATENFDERGLIMEDVQKNAEKKAFLFRKAVLDTIETFPDDVKLQLAKNLFEYGITGSHGPCDDVVMAILRPMKIAIDSEKNRYYNKQFLDCLSRAVRVTQINATQDSLRKKCAETEKALRRVYSEVTHHDIPDIKVLIVQTIGVDMWNMIAEHVYIPKAVREHFSSIGIEFSSEKSKAAQTSPGPQRVVDPQYSCYGRGGR